MRRERLIVLPILEQHMQLLEVRQRDLRQSVQQKQSQVVELRGKLEEMKLQLVRDNADAAVSQSRHRGERDREVACSTRLSDLRSRRENDSRHRSLRHAPAWRS
jgi:hypothetical protein